MNWKIVVSSIAILFIAIVGQAYVLNAAEEEQLVGWKYPAVNYFECSGIIGPYNDCRLSDEGITYQGIQDTPGFRVKGSFNSSWAWTVSIIGKPGSRRYGLNENSIKVDINNNKTIWYLQYFSDLSSRKLYTYSKDGDSVFLSSITYSNRQDEGADILDFTAVPKNIIIEANNEYWINLNNYTYQIKCYLNGACVTIPDSENRYIITKKPEGTIVVEYLGKITVFNTVTRYNTKKLWHPDSLVLPDSEKEINIGWKYHPAEYVVCPTSDSGAYTNNCKLFLDGQINEIKCQGCENTFCSVPGYMVSGPQSFGWGAFKFFWEGPPTPYYFGIYENSVKNIDGDTYWYLNKKTSEGNIKKYFYVKENNGNVLLSKIFYYGSTGSGELNFIGNIIRDVIVEIQGESWINFNNGTYKLICGSDNTCVTSPSKYSITKSDNGFIIENFEDGKKIRFGAAVTKNGNEKWWYVDRTTLEDGSYAVLNWNKDPESDEADPIPVDIEYYNRDGQFNRKASIGNYPENVGISKVDVEVDLLASVASHSAESASSGTMTMYISSPSIQWLNRTEAFLGLTWLQILFDPYNLPGPMEVNLGIAVAKSVAKKTFSTVTKDAIELGMGGDSVNLVNSVKALGNTAKVGGIEKNEILVMAMAQRIKSTPYAKNIVVLAADYTDDIGYTAIKGFCVAPYPTENGIKDAVIGLAKIADKNGGIGYLITDTATFAAGNPYQKELMETLAKRGLQLDGIPVTGVVSYSDVLLGANEISIPLESSLLKASETVTRLYFKVKPIP